MINQDQDQEQFNPECLQEHMDFLKRLARSLVWDKSQADDLIQNALVMALERPPTHSGAMRAWLGRVVHNYALMEYRKKPRRQKREKAAARPDTLPSTNEMVERQEVTSRVLAAVKSLPEPYFSAVHLRYYENQPIKEIARNQGVSIHTIKSRLQKGREKLRTNLDREYGNDRQAWLGMLLPFAGLPKITAAAVGAAILHQTFQVSTLAVAGACALVATLLYLLLPGPIEDMSGQAQPGSNGIVQAAAAQPQAEVPPAKAAGDALVRRRSGSLVALENEDVGLRGEVFNRLTGKPIGGAKISLSYNSRALVLPGLEEWGEPCMDRQRKIVAGLDGCFQLAGLIENSQCLLHIRAPGFYSPIKKYLRLGSGTTDLGRLYLSPLTAIKVKIFDHQRQPLAGVQVIPVRSRCQLVEKTNPAQVHAFPPNWERWHSLDTHRWLTDKDGMVTLAGLTPGIYRFCMHGRGRQSKWSSPVTVSAGVENRWQTDLAPGRDLLVRVLDGQGKPVSGAQVKVREFPAPTPQTTLSVRTNTQGEAWLGGFKPSSRVQLNAIAKAGARWVRLNAIPEEPTTLTLKANANSLSNDVKVKFNWVDPVPEEQEFFLAVTLLEGRETTQSRIMPIGKRASVYWHNSIVHKVAPGRESLTVHCPASGRCVAVLYSPYCGFQLSTPFELDGTGLVTTEIRVEKNSGLSLAGKVVTALARPADNTMVTVLARPEKNLWPRPITPVADDGPDSWLPCFRVRTDGKGHFVLNGVAPGTYLLAAGDSALGIAVKRVELSAQTTGMEHLVCFNAGGQVRGVVNNYGDEKPENLLVSLDLPRLGIFLATQPDRAGHFAFSGLAAGAYKIQVTKVLISETPISPNTFRVLGTPVPPPTSAQSLNLGANERRALALSFQQPGIFGVLNSDLTALPAGPIQLVYHRLDRDSLTDQWGRGDEVFEHLLPGGQQSRHRRFLAGHYLAAVWAGDMGQLLAWREVTISPDRVNRIVWQVQQAKVTIELTGSGKGKIVKCRLLPVLARQAVRNEVVSLPLVRAGSGFMVASRVPYGVYRISVKCREQREWSVLPTLVQVKTAQVHRRISP